jgi:hypothetical protein
MDKKTLKALEGSIEKWEKIIKYKEQDHGSSNCPLCIVFPLANCYGCPIAIKTKKDGCRGTPYTKWFKHNQKMHDGLALKIHCPICRKIAKDELAFLKSLLPKVKSNGRKN